MESVSAQERDRSLRRNGTGAAFMASSQAAATKIALQDSAVTEHIQ